MAKAIVILLSVLAILSEQTRDYQVDVVIAQQMKEHEIFLNEKMTQMWEEIEWTRPLEEVPLLVMLQHWLFWVPASVVLCWLIWQRKIAFHRIHELDTSREQEEEYLSGAHSDAEPFAEFTLSPMQDLPYMGRTLKKLVRDLLEVCHVLSQNTFMPELHLATGKHGITESWNDSGDQILYQLVVFLKPPPGHIFMLQPSVGMGRCSNIHVVLECTCSRMTGYTLCFVHSTRINQHSRLMRTLCTDSHLDGKKFTIWVQNLVEAAWKHLPYWHDWELSVLPSSQSCRVQLSGPSNVQLCTVLVFAVQQGSPGTFLLFQ